MNHSDFKTAEYKADYPGNMPPYKWEFCRGFGCNQIEGPEHVMSTEKIIRILSDVVSKGGNLLLNIGPKTDGTISEIQTERLLGIGKWLEKNEEALYGTHPRVRATGKTPDGSEVRFTKKNDSLYVIILDDLKSEKITLKSIAVSKKTDVTVLNKNDRLKYRQEGKDLSVVVPEITKDYTTVL